jgi:hypothetical protein
MASEFYIPDEDIQMMVRQEYQKDSRQYIDEATRILAQAAPDAARMLVRLAANADNERIRLQATQAILDRNLGRVGDMAAPGAVDPAQEILGAVLREPSKEELG